MPRKKQTIHASGLVEVKVTVGKTIDGKRIQKSFYGHSKLEAKQKADDYILEQEVANRTGTSFIAKEYTFAEWANKWLETYKKPHVSENTYRLTYLNTVKTHLTPYLGVAKLSDIKPIDVQKLFQEKCNLSETMLNKMKLCLNGIFDTAIDNDLCYKNPAKNVVYSSIQDKHTKLVYTAGQIEKVKELAMSEFPDAVVILETGMRRGELLGLRWNDIDISARTISVRRSIADSKINRISINPPKWDSYRTIVLSSDAMTLKLLDTYPHTCDYVFPNQNNEPQLPNVWARKLERFMNTTVSSNDIPCLTAHELRHTYGTNLRRNGVDIYTIQKLMGHKDIKMTSELYVHNEVEELKKAIR